MGGVIMILEWHWRKRAVKSYWYLLSICTLNSTISEIYFKQPVRCHGWAQMKKGHMSRWLWAPADGHMALLYPLSTFVCLKIFQSTKKITKKIYKERNICANFTWRSWSISCIFPCVSWIVCIVLNDFFFFNLYFYLFYLLFTFLSESHHSSAISEVIEMESPMEG